jgi:hypothetical protein
MKARHAAGVALVGWYLMQPHVLNFKRPGRKAIDN